MLGNSFKHNSNELAVFKISVYSVYYDLITVRTCHLQSILWVLDKTFFTIHLSLKKGIIAFNG